MMRKTGLLLGAAIGMGMMAQTASAAEIKVLTTGAFRSVVVALVPEFEKATGHKVVVDNGTVGQLQKRVDGGETFDVLVLSPKGIEDYIKGGKIAAGSNARLAKVGVGVMVKDGAPKPDVSTRRCVQAGAAQGQDRRLHRSGERRLERHLRFGPAGQARHRRPDQAQGQAQAGRSRLRSGQERRGRDRHPPDERDRRPGRRDPGRPAAGRDPELHGLCGWAEHRRQETPRRPRPSSRC